MKFAKKFLSSKQIENSRKRNQRSRLLIHLYIRQMNIMFDVTAYCICANRFGIYYKFKKMLDISFRDGHAVNSASTSERSTSVNTENRFFAFVSLTSDQILSGYSQIQRRPTGTRLLKMLPSCCRLRHLFRPFQQNKRIGSIQCPH